MTEHSVHPDYSLRPNQEARLFYFEQPKFFNLGYQNQSFKSNRLTFCFDTDDDFRFNLRIVKCFGETIWNLFRLRRSLERW